MPKIAILRFSSIGDIVLTTPVVRMVKKQLPNAEVHYITKPAFRGILENNPYVDKVHCLDGTLKELLTVLKSENFDYVIDLHNNLRTLLIRLSLGVPSRGFDKLNTRKWLLVNLKLNALPKKHIVDRYIEATTDLGIVNDGEGLDYFISNKDIVPISSLPEAFHKGYVAMAIGAQHFTKRLPTSKIISLCEKIDRPVVLLGGKEDAVQGELIEKALLLKGKNILNGCGKYSLNGSASLVKNAYAVVSHDTGLMHIAAAFKKKLYSIWGSTVPEFGMYPYKTRYHILENKTINCRPCSKIGFSACPKGHFNCLEQLSFDSIVL